jgi:RNA polymerase sigma factor (sigma-70 family)
MERVQPESAVDQLSDSQLLNRFADQGDDKAFALLIKRHGGEIFRFCKRMLGQDADAEDALQSTFVVLARHAGAQQWRRSIGQWLFRVAYYIALKSRENLESQPVALRNEPEHEQGPLDALELDELGEILFEELNGLPSIFRQPLALCYLRGLSQEEAARRLGMPRRTLQRRLEQGRLRLRRRFESRGLSSSICRLTIRIEGYVLDWLNELDNGKPSD